MSFRHTKILNKHKNKTRTVKKTHDKPARIISAVITAGDERTRYPAAGDREHTKPVAAEIMKKTGEIVIFEDGIAVDAFKPSAFFAPDAGQTGLFWKGKHRGQGSDPAHYAPLRRRGQNARGQNDTN